MKFKGMSSSASNIHVMHENPTTPNAKVLTMKSFQISSRKSLEGDRGVYIFAGAKKFQSTIDENNHGFGDNKKSHMGGALDLLLDAIQLIEHEDRLKDAKTKTKTLFNRPVSVGHQTSVDYGHKCTNKMTSKQLSCREDCQKHIVNISMGYDADNGAKPQGPTKRRRLQALPSKYSDSVLLPWK